MNAREFIDRLFDDTHSLLSSVEIPTESTEELLRLLEQKQLLLANKEDSFTLARSIQQFHRYVIEQMQEAFLSKDGLQMPEREIDIEEFSLLVKAIFTMFRDIQKVSSIVVDFRSFPNLSEILKFTFEFDKITYSRHHAVVALLVYEYFSWLMQTLISQYPYLDMIRFSKATKRIHMAYQELATKIIELYERYKE